MSVLSSRRLHAAVLCAFGACAISMTATAGDGVDCPQKAARMNVEGGANGTISASEHAAGAQKRFDAMDSNHDGRLTAAELGSSHGAERIAWARNSVSADDKVRKFDRNKDGALSASEYADGSQAMFDELDTDSDGYLRADEMELNVSNRVSAR